MFALLTLVARTAGAQTTTTSGATISVAYETSLPRVDPQGNQLQKRNLTLTPEAVSNQDCIDDQRIRFTLLMSGYVANSSVEAWAANSGQDCSAATNRAGGVQQCWKILDSAISLQPQVSVDIPVRRIMSGVTPFTPLATDSTINACGKVDLANISVQFLYFDPGNLSQASVNHTIAVAVDTVGPAAPTGLTVLPGNTRLQVNWTNISGGDPDAGVTGGLTELTGVAIYCAPSDGTSGIATTTETDAGCTRVATDSGLDETGDASDSGLITVCQDAGISTTTDVDAGSAVCSSDAFTAVDAGTSTATDAGDDSGTTTATTITGVIPNAAFNAQYQCGSYTGNSGTTVVAEGLTNGRNYAVAVAATDKYGNVGALSGIQCEIPEETTDFWEEYRAAGGMAGGCATVEEPFPLGTLTAGAALVVLGASVRRRRRNRR